MLRCKWKDKEAQKYAKQDAVSKIDNYRIKNKLKNKKQMLP